MMAPSLGNRCLNSMIPGTCRRPNGPLVGKTHCCENAVKRRLTLPLLGLLWIVLSAGGWARSEVAGSADLAEAAAAAMVTPAAERATAAGLKYLAARQREDGSFGSGAYRGNVAVTALVGMAFLAEGSLPNRGPHGDVTERALNYLLDQCRENGLILNAASASRGPMYEHGFATLFLAECLGSTPRTDLREKLAAAVALIVNTQNAEGGWRYQPQKLDADISVTVCQIMALRAARNAGLHVPKETVERCIEYVRRSQNPDGGFRYMLPPGESGFARSAAGVVALYSAGIYEGAEVENGISYLLDFVPRPGALRQEPYYFYGHYYAVQALWQRGGDAWMRYYPAIREELILRQSPDGSWADPISPEYGTAMACLILQVPNGYLPIFER